MRRLRRASIKTPEDGGEHFETIVIGMGLGDDYASRELQTIFELVPSHCKPAQCAPSLFVGYTGLAYSGMDAPFELLPTQKHTLMNMSDH